MYKIKFVYLLGLSAFVLASVAAYFSVTGLATLFSGAFYSVIVMMSGLELAKLVVASYLYRYWDNIATIFKAYLTIGVLVLMIITSAGIYGFLSSAYSITSDKLEKVDYQINVLEKKKEILNKNIQGIQDNINVKNNRINTLTSLRQQQEVRIDTLYSRKMISGVRKTEQIIKEANKEIENLTLDIDRLNTKSQIYVDSLNVFDIQILEFNSNDIKGEVGPLKYIATLTGKSIDQVVNFFILLLIFVFDPLAVCLVIATNKVLLKEGGGVKKQLEMSVDDWVYKWKLDKGEETLRINYPLDENSIIFDLGNVEIEWVEKMYELYKCTIYIFEPSKFVCNEIREKFKENHKIKVNDFTLSVAFLKALRLKKIDLMKINIDGLEYAFLKELLSDNVCYTIINYQIQFTRSINSFLEKYETIKERFASNKYLHTYCYPFVWENFKKINEIRNKF